ncbi:MAG: TraB/GumN family protein [Deltaproteobacteria bacterium]|jgi:pheromone shutdown-related protein TraB|nr:TraB/GumN family protein [Deltaproteobacteria bacterium]
MQCIDHTDIKRIQLDNREIIIIGTAHISQDSVDTVISVIEAENPDTVCVELDQQRFQALQNPKHWESLNLVQVLRKGQAPFLLANLALAAFQKRMGLQTGVKPGAELFAAAKTEQQLDKQLILVDREIRTTLLRAWRKAGFWKKLQLLVTLMSSMFEGQKIDEAELARLRQTDTLTVMLDELGTLLPTVKAILVDERDTFMAHNIRQAGGNKIVAVIGAAHVPGMSKKLLQNTSAEEIAELSTIPPKKAVSKIVPWLIPALVILLFVVGFFAGDRQVLAEAALAWILANGLLSAAGALLALAHPMTILVAFIAAPITSLNPTIGAGFVTGLAQAFLSPPQVRDMQSMADDIAIPSGWWRNRLTRVLLVFFFSSLGSAIGTVVAFGWLKNLL